MTRKEIVRLCLLDAAHGESYSLMGMLDYLLVDCAIEPDRLVKIANRHFDLPNLVAWGALWDLHPSSIQ